MFTSTDYIANSISGAHVNAQTNTGATALLLAASGGHLEAMQVLLRQPKVDKSLCSHYLSVLHKLVLVPVLANNRFIIICIKCYKCITKVNYCSKI